MSSKSTKDHTTPNGVSVRLTSSSFGSDLTAENTAFNYTAPPANESPSRTPVCGVGVNDLPEHAYFIDKATKKLRQRPAYSAWTSMLNRAYNPKIHARLPGYAGCSVHPEWHTFSGFKSWFDGNFVEGWCLDKDLICPGNKIYSASHCRYVPQYINTLVLDGEAARGQWPLGVTKQKHQQKYCARCCINGKQKYLGSYASPLLAHRAWQMAKAQVLHTTLERYKQEKVVDMGVVRSLKEYAERLESDAASGQETKGFSK